MTNLPAIPIRNIYYLLCYAWNKLEERDLVDIGEIDSTELVDLFAKVMIGGLNHLLKRGLDRNYVDFSEDTRCLKGKVLFSQSVKRNLFRNAKAHVEYDDLSHDVIHNQIIKGTINELTRAENLDKTLKIELIGLLRKIGRISDIKVSRRDFRTVQLHQNNSFYEFLLKICEIVLDNLLPSGEQGQSKFRDFFQDEKIMPHLFEEFVRNFYKIETEHKVGREDIFWDAISKDKNSMDLLPKMTTDISIDRGGSKVVIDTKFYKEAFSSHYEVEKFHSGNLYQLMAYLKNLEKKGGVNENCSGVLLYPATSKSFKAEYDNMLGHKVVLGTIDLNQDWKGIHYDLIQLLEAV